MDAHIQPVPQGYLCFNQKKRGIIMKKSQNQTERYGTPHPGQTALRKAQRTDS